MSSGVARLAPETSSSERTATRLCHVYERRYASALRSAPAPEGVSLPARRGPLRADHGRRPTAAMVDSALPVLCWHPLLWYPIGLPVDDSLGKGARGSFGRSYERSRTHQMFCCFEVRGHKGVVLGIRDILPDTLEDGAGRVAWLQGGAEIEGLGSAGRFDGEDAGDVPEEPAKLAARAPAHRVVVFLHG